MRRLLLLAFLLVLCGIVYGQPHELTRDVIEKKLKERSDSPNPIEGIWEVATTMEYYHHDTLYDVVKSSEPLSIAIVKSDEKYQSYNLSGTPYEAEFISTDVKGVYLYRIYFSLAKQYSGTQAVICTKDEMEYTYDLPDWYLGTKTGSAHDDGMRIVNVLKWKKQSSTDKR